MSARWQVLGVVGLLASILAAGGWVLWSVKRNQAETATLHKDEVSQVSTQPVSVSALGTLVPRGRIRRVAAPINFSRVGRLCVEEGAQVAQGQQLAFADDYELKNAELQQAEAQVGIAQAKLDKLLAGPNPHEVQALDASLRSLVETRQQRKRELERASILAKNNSIAMEEFEAMQLRLTVAQHSVAELQAKQQLLQSVRDEDVRVLQAELHAAETQLRAARQRLADSTIVAPIDGTVLRIHVREGERPTETGILELGDTRQMQVVAEVYEADAGKLRAGQPAKVRLKSSQQELFGKVTHVQPMVGRKSVLDNDPVSDADARVVEAMVELAPADSQHVRSLSNARVEVIIQIEP